MSYLVAKILRVSGRVHEHLRCWFCISDPGHSAAQKSRWHWTFISAQLEPLPFGAHLWVFLAFPIYTQNGDSISQVRLVHFKGLFQSLPLFCSLWVRSKVFENLCPSWSYSKVLFWNRWLLESLAHSRHSVYVYGALAYMLGISVLR